MKQNEEVNEFLFEVLDHFNKFHHVWIGYMWG